MVDAFATLKGKYKYATPAEALFFGSAGLKALRLEAPDIGKEFTDGLSIGKDPSGILFYRDRVRFDSTDLVYYEVTRETNPSDSKVLARIKFYHDPDTGKKRIPHAEFLAYDKEETVNSASMDGCKQTGHWQDLSLAMTTARAYRPSDVTTVDFSVPFLKKKATWDVTVDEDSIDNSTVDVRGVLYLKDFTTFTTGDCVSYNNDRLVFYKSGYIDPKDFVGFFIPFQDASGKLGITADNTQVYTGVTWSNITA